MHCKRIIRKIEKRSLGSYSSVDSVEIKLHLSYCRSCRSYETDSKILDTLLRDLFQENREFSYTNAEKESLISKMRSLQDI
jgi:predicted anti-sigma-YlaC factor YlaD